MKPSGTIEYNSLSWVKQQLDAVLNDAQTALSEYIENGNAALMDDCIEGLRLTYGTLQMVEIFGASMLAEEMEQTAKAIVEEKVDNRGDAFDVLMRAMLQLPDYLESLQAGHKDTPMALLPLLNDMRTVRKESLLSENVMFFPDIENVEVDEQQIEAPKTESGRLYSEAKRLRTHYQLGLLDLLKNNKPREGCQRMLAVIASLEKVSVEQSVRRFWSVIAALLEGVYEEGIDPNVSVKMLLGGADRQIKLLIDIGEDDFAAQYSQELLKNILYYIGHSKSSGKRVEHIKEIYNLEELLSAGEEGDDTGMGGLNAELFATVSQGIKEDLAQVKDALEIFIHSTDKNVNDLAPQVEHLTRIADTYGMLGLGEPRQKVIKQKDLVQKISEGNAEVNEEVIFAIAGELLSAEDDLNNYIAQRTGVADYAEDEDSVVSASEYRDVMSTVIAQGLQNFTDAKEAILAFTSGIGDDDSLKSVLSMLEEVRGVSMMLPMAQVEAMLVKLKDYVKIALLDNHHQPDEEEQDTVADVVTAIEYFFEAMSEGRPGVEAGLRTGEQALSKLVQVYSRYEAAPDSAAEQAGGEDAGEQVSEDEPEPEPKPQKGEVVELKKPKTVPAETTDYRELEILGDDVDEEILDIFIEESVEVLETLHNTLPEWKSNTADEEALATVRRSFHTLKGSGRLVGAQLLGEFSWRFENMLNRVIDNKIEADSKLMNALDEALTVLPQLIEQLRGNREPVPNVFHLMETADALAEGVEPPPVSESVPAAGEQTAEAVSETFEPSELAEEIGLDLGIEESATPELATDETEVELEQEPAEETEPAAQQGSAPDDVYVIDLSESAEETAADETEIAEIDISDIAAEETDEILPDVVETADETVAEPETEEAVEVEAASGETVAADEFAIEIDESMEEEEEEELAAGMDPVLFKIYYDESIGHLNQVQKLLDAHNESHTPLTASKDMVRAFHTLYGSARTAEIDQIAELCGVTEKYVKIRQEGRDLSINDDIASLIAEVAQTVRAMLEQIKSGSTPEHDKVLLERINKAVQAELQDQLQQSSGGSAEAVGYDEELQVEDDRAEPQQAEAAEEAATVAISYDDIDSDLIDIFIEEADELIENCEDLLQKITSNPNDTDSINQLQRYMHTLKGGARMAELTPLGDLTHLLESLVIKVTENQVTADKALFDTLNESVDSLAGMLKDVKDRAPVDSASELKLQIEALMKGEVYEKRAVERFDLDIDDISAKEADAESEDKKEATDKSEAEQSQADEGAAAEQKLAEVMQGQNYGRRATDRKDRPQWGERATDVNYRDTQDQVRVRADLLNDLVNSAGEVNIYHARMGKQMSDIGFNLGELESTVVRLKQQLRNMDIETEIQIRSSFEKESDQYDEDFDPLEMDKYSTLQQLSRSLAETASDVDSIRDILSEIVRDSETLLLQESRVSTELQEGLMRTRMVRFGGLATRLRRIVRQVTKELNKEVELELVGEQNELDRTILDRIIAPLEHMLRNAVAHGVELPEDRKAAGKPESGLITITVDRQGADVIIKVRDDGAGISADKIREKAIKQGLMEADSELSDYEVLQFILHTGFSTAESVSQVAGRGVGMDVVDSELKQLGGTLEIDTELGRGTEFTIRLPLTLAINQALLVSTGEDVFAIPLASIEGVVRVTGAELQRFYNSEQGVYEFNNVQYELKHLGELLTGQRPDYSDQYGLFPVLLSQVGDHHYALHVDELVGRREIVVKPVGMQVSTVRGIAGATILADGRVVLIIEISALLVGEGLHRHIEAEGAQEAAPAAAAERARETTIMVVDDSITIRKVTARMLERNNINVLLAKDGIDATNQLIEHKPDLMLLDIEMPRMDGFELATYIRNDERLKDLPIIMITSRTGEKHKEKAMEIGVNQYLGKPYQEEELMKNIQEILEA